MNGEQKQREYRDAQGRKLGGGIPSSDDCIEVFATCALCETERPKDQSPKEWARLNVGITKIGIQIWCVRHDCNVVHIDTGVDPQRLPMNSRAVGPKITTPVVS